MGETGKAACLKKHTWYIHVERHVEKVLTHKELKEYRILLIFSE